MSKQNKKITAGELIEVLKQYPADAKIWLFIGLDEEELTNAGIIDNIGDNGWDILSTGAKAITYDREHNVIRIADDTAVEHGY